MDIYKLVYTIFRRFALSSLFLLQSNILWKNQLLPRHDMVHIIKMIKLADLSQPL